MLIISGNIDVSVGSLIGVLATVSGSLAVAGWPLILSWTVPVLCGMAVTGLVGLMVPTSASPRSWSRWACSRS
jgi:ABC-type xylose transport system permease subunit